MFPKTRTWYIHFKDQGKSLQFWKNRRVDGQEYIVQFLLLFPCFRRLKHPYTQIQGQLENFKFSQKSTCRPQVYILTTLVARFVFSRPQNPNELTLGHFFGKCSGSSQIDPYSLKGAFGG